MKEVHTYLRLRPLEQKHKLKEDYFTIKEDEEVKVTDGMKQKSSITIHDPLKRSKEQFEFKFDKVYT